MTQTNGKRRPDRRTGKGRHEADGFGSGLFEGKRASYREPGAPREGIPVVIVAMPSLRSPGYVVRREDGAVVENVSWYSLR